MSSNSPVLLMAPSSVPTGPLLAPMLITKMDARARGLMSVSQSVEVLTSKTNLKLTEHAMIESTESKSVCEASPATPAPVSAPASSTTFATAMASSGFVFSSRQPSSKVATSPAKVQQSANAAPIIGSALTPTTSSVPTPTISPPPTLPVKPVTSTPVTPLTIQAPPVAPAAASLPAPPTPPATAISPPVTRGSPLLATGKRAAASASATPSTPPSTPSSPTLSSAASSPSASMASPKPGKSQTGRWTEAEHKLFLKGLEQFPYRAWKKIATLIKTRTVVQIRTHAQKYYQKLEKEEQRMRERETQLATQQGTSSVVSTPRAEPMSAPSTPAATSFHELSQPSSAFAAPASMGAVGDAMGAVGKRKGPLRKRKGSSDEDDDDDYFIQSSLPKRMMKEKKFVREKTMSPKQKNSGSTGRVFSFGDFGGCDNGSDASSSKSSSMGSIRGLNGLKTNPLDFDDDDDVSTATTMMLDFAEEKPIVDYPFALDNALEQGLAGMDHDELLQLSDDDENMEWFSSSSTSTTGDDDADEVDQVASPVASTLDLGRNPFSPLYSEDCLQFVDPSPSTPIQAAAANECSTPSPILIGLADCSDFALSGDEADDDDDFVLDPEKFLSSYFHPDGETTES